MATGGLRCADADSGMAVDAEAFRGDGCVDRGADDRGDAGVFLWATRLGLADHHAAEALFSLLAVAALCAAAESEGRKRWVLAALAGLALGAFLGSRPNGVFVPLLIGASALAAPELGAVVLASMPTAALMFLPVTGCNGSTFAWLSLGACGGMALLACALQILWRRRGWRHLPAVVMGVAGVAAALLLVATPLISEQVRSRKHGGCSPIPAAGWVRFGSCCRC